MSQMVLYAVLLENTLASSLGCIPDRMPMFIASDVAWAMSAKQ